jgi:hypothetical protein
MLENEVTEHKLNKSFQRKNYLLTYKEMSNLHKLNKSFQRKNYLFTYMEMRYYLLEHIYEKPKTRQ